MAVTLQQIANCTPATFNIATGTQQSLFARTRIQTPASYFMGRCQCALLVMRRLATPHRAIDTVGLLTSGRSTNGALCRIRSHALNAQLGSEIAPPLS